MSGLDLRGFDYALEPARQRAHHRVDTAIGLLGQRQRAVAEARQRADSLREQCRELARRATPGPRAAIDPRRALAVSHFLLQLRQRLEAAEDETRALEVQADEARGQLERSRVDQQAFDGHREEAVQAHAIQSARREQAAADQDWLARQHVLQKGHGEDGEPA
jgi:flagellar biosynthesis chaperone FliJ